MCFAEAILNSFVLGDSKLAVQCKSLFIAYSEEEMQSRLKNFRAARQLQQLETCFLVANPSNPPVRRNRVSDPKTTTSGNVIAGAPLINLNTSWCLTLSLKKELFGAMRIAVGGTVPDGGAIERSDEKVEPVSWHATAELIWVELLKSETQATAVLDWCPVDVLPFKCLELGIPYIGIVFTKRHGELLYERLAEMVWWKMCRDEKSRFYRPELAKILGTKKSAKPPVPKPGPKPNPKPEPKPAPSAPEPKPKPAEGEEKQEPPQKKLKKDGDQEDDERKADLKRKLQQKLQQSLNQS